MASRFQQIRDKKKADTLTKAVQAGDVTTVEKVSQEAVEQNVQKALNDGRTIVIPKAGLGTGRAELATRAPKINEYLQNRLRNAHILVCTIII